MSRYFLLAVVCLCLFSVSVQAQIPMGYKSVAQKYGIPEKLFFAIMMQESSAVTKKGHKPWPWTLNIKGVGGKRYKTRLQAYLALEEALKTTSIVDVGLGQINWHYHQQHFNSTWQALDPYTNLQVAATILLTEYKRCGNWWEAVGRYHSPGKKEQQKQRAKKYTQRVKQRYQQLTS